MEELDRLENFKIALNVDKMVILNSQPLLNKYILDLIRDLKSEKLISGIS